MPNLFPELNLPTILTPRSQREFKYRPSPNFDFEVGDFVLDSRGRMTLADGQESFAQWCIKTCLTERRTRLAYSEKIGVEMNSAVKEPTSAAVKSAVARTITEAILVHPAAVAVKNFKFQIEADKVRVDFTVQARDLPDVNLSVVY